MEEEDMTSKKLGWVLLMWLLCFVYPCHSQETALPQTSADSTTTVLTEDATANIIDSMAARDDFVTASLLILAPLKVLYSVFGHAMLRMECPTHQLDYIYSFESEEDVGTFMRVVAGKAKAKYIAVPTDTFLKDCRETGREVRQYRLNLKPREKQELWQLLDNELLVGAHRNFNLLYTNCLSTTIIDVQRCLIGEHFEWGPLPFPQTLKDGDFLRYAVRHSPWAEFVFITFIGTAYESYSDINYKLMPETIISMLREATIIDDKTGESRFVVTDPGVVLVKDGGKNKGVPVSPTMVFGALLVLTLAITALERWMGYHHLAKWFDILLFSAQALVELLILYILFFSEIFMGAWNWYLIGFLPFPLFIWSCLRGRCASFCWLTYCILLLLFITATPFIGALDLPHQLITAALLVRCGSHFFMTKQK